MSRGLKFSPAFWVCGCIMGTWFTRLITILMYHTFFFLWCWAAHHYVSCFSLLHWDDSLTCFLLSRYRKWKDPAFFISKPYWGLGWAYNLWLLSWVLVPTPGKSTGSPGNTFFHFSLSETLQGTICCVGVVIGIINMPPFLMIFSHLPLTPHERTF